MDSTQQEQWDDETISKELGYVTYGGTSHSGKYDTLVVDRDDAMELLVRMRDDLLAQLATLRQERDDCRELYRSLRTEANMLLEERDKAEAERDQLRVPLAALDTPGAWEPLEPGAHEHSQGTAYIDHNYVPSFGWSTTLRALATGQQLPVRPFEFRLCRRHATPQPAPEAQPDWLAKFPPEWDRHPWANWACLVVSYSNFDGVTLTWNYFEDRPKWGELSYNWVSGTHGFANPVTRAPLSLVFDTKDTLVQKPAPEAND